MIRVARKVKVVGFILKHRLNEANNQLMISPQQLE